MDAAVLSLFVRGAALGISAAASPGPLQALLISETLLGGVRRGARVTLAPLVSDAPIVVLVLLVLRRMPPSGIAALSIAGGAYVLWLALGMWRQWRTAGNGQVQDPHAASIGWMGLRRAVVVNLLNPNPYVFWMLVSGPILVTALGQSPLHGVAFVGGFYGVFVAAMLVIVVLFHQARRLGPRFVRAMLLLSIAILVAFGALLIRQGLGALA